MSNVKYRRRHQRRELTSARAAIVARIASQPARDRFRSPRFGRSASQSPWPIGPSRDRRPLRANVLAVNQYARRDLVVS